MVTQKELGARIKAVRRAGKESRKAFCERTKLNEHTLKYWENGGGYPDLLSMDILCKAFGYDYNTLLQSPYQEGEQRTQQYAELAEQTKLSEEGITAIRGSDPYAIAFFESLMLSEEMGRLVWEYRQCYLQVQRYAYFLENEGLRAVFQEVYALAGVNITDSFEEFKKRLFMKREKPLNLPPDLPQDDESLKTILNAFYAERLMNSREKDIETELFDILHRFIEKSEEVAQQELERQNRQAIEITGKPYPEEWK